MPNVFISLTKKQAKTLLTHWRANYRYGEGGTFGNGDRIVEKADFKRAQEIIYILETAILKSK